MELLSQLDATSLHHLQHPFQQIYSNEKQNMQGETHITDDVNLNISSTAKAMNKVESFLNLGTNERMDMDDLSPEERDQFLSMLSKLLKQGVVGYEVIEVDGEPEKHFIVNQIGNDRLEGAKLYDEFGDYIF